MKTKLMIMALSAGLVFAGTAKVSMQKAALVSSKGTVDLVVESEREVHGIQFDLKYNPAELSFNDAESLLDDFTFEYSVKEDGAVRGLMFSMKGEKMNTSDISSLISFDFSPVNNFRGVSNVNFDNVILAGENGTNIVTTTASIAVDTNDLLPVKTALNASYPNPFNPSTAINYDLSAEGMVNITVYDALGRTVAELVNGIQNGGSHQITWNAADIASGAYFVRMNAGSYTNTQKLMLVK